MPLALFRRIGRYGNGSLDRGVVSGVTTAPANPASGGAASKGGGKLPPLNQQVHPVAIKLVVNVKLSGVFQTLNTKFLQNPSMLANLGIFSVKNLSLCLKSGTNIVHFKVNFVFFQAKQQTYALSSTISFSELIVPDKNSQSL